MSSPAAAAIPFGARLHTRLLALMLIPKDFASSFSTLSVKLEVWVISIVGTWVPVMVDGRACTGLAEGGSSAAGARGQVTPLHTVGAKRRNCSRGAFYENGDLGALFASTKRIRCDPKGPILT